MQSKSSREKWQERVRAWQASGLSRAQFAQREKVHPATLSWWRWKLASDEGTRRRARKERGRAEAPLTFVQIPPQPTSAGSAGESRIELEVGRVRLRVPDQFRPETLERLLEVLEGHS